MSKITVFLLRINWTQGVVISYFTDSETFIERIWFLFKLKRKISWESYFHYGVNNLTMHLH